MLRAAVAAKTPLGNEASPSFVHVATSLQHVIGQVQEDYLHPYVHMTVCPC